MVRESCVLVGGHVCSFLSLNSMKGDYAQGVHSVTWLMESGPCPHSLFSGGRCTGGWMHPHGADHIGAELVPLSSCQE